MTSTIETCKACGMHMLTGLLAKHRCLPAWEVREHGAIEWTKVHAIDGAYAAERYAEDYDAVYPEDGVAAGYKKLQLEVRCYGRQQDGIEIFTVSGETVPSYIVSKR